MWRQSLTVKQSLSCPEGAPIHVVLTEKVRYRKEQPVHARTVDPVFAFDREVIPSGTEVLGRISGFKSPSRLVRIRAVAGGNFTPIREPQLVFESLVLNDGETLPLQTEVNAGADTVVRFNAGAAEEKKGKIAAATELARQQIENKKRQVLDTIKSPGKMDRIKEALWSLAPWHPQYLTPGARFTAKLQAPLTFGEVGIDPTKLTELGDAAPRGCCGRGAIDQRARFAHGQPRRRGRSGYDASVAEP